jgi:hypothetical protein
LLSGAESSDSDDDDVLSFSWTLTEPQGAEIILNNANGPEASFSAPEVESDTLFVFELLVSDGKGGSDSDPVEVMVKNVVAVPQEPQLPAIPVLNNTNNSSLATSTVKSARYYGCEYPNFSKYTLNNIIEVDYPNSGWTIETKPDTVRFLCQITLSGNSSGLIKEASSSVQIMVYNPQLPVGYDTLPKVAQWVTDNLIKQDVDFSSGIRSLVKFDNVTLAGLPAYGILAQGDYTTSPGFGLVSKYS